MANFKTILPWLLYIKVLFQPTQCEKIGNTNVKFEITGLGHESCGHKGLEELCKTVRDALACNVSPYCIHCVWSTAIIPTTDSDIKCGKCQTILKYTTQKEYSAKLEKACKIHSGDDFKTCLQLVQNVISRDFICSEFLHSNISTHDTYSLLGMCYSRFEANLPSSQINRPKGSKLERRYIIEGRSGGRKSWCKSKISAGKEKGVKIKRIEIGERNYYSHKPTFIPYGSNSPHYSQTTKYSCEFVENGEDQIGCDASFVFGIFAIIFLFLMFMIVLLIANKRLQV